MYEYIPHTGRFALVGDVVCEVPCLWKLAAACVFRYIFSKLAHRKLYSRGQICHSPSNSRSLLILYILRKLLWLYILWKHVYFQQANCFVASLVDPGGRGAGGGCVKEAFFIKRLYFITCWDNPSVNSWISHFALCMLFKLRVNAFV